MQQQTIVACALAVAALTTAPPLGTKAQTEPGSAANTAQLVDPGFESFKLSRAPSAGWYSDDVNPNEPQNALVTMTPDNQTRVEGQYSLRIEQVRPRPRGQAFLSQAVSLSKQGGNRSFDLSMQMRGRLTGPITIHVYVWSGNIAKIIGQREAQVNMEWSKTSLSFRVPNGYDSFGIWIYLPRDYEALVWLDDIRLLASKKN